MFLSTSQSSDILCDPSALLTLSALPMPLMNQPCLSTMIIMPPAVIYPPNLAPSTTSAMSTFHHIGEAFVRQSGIVQPYCGSSPIVMLLPQKQAAIQLPPAAPLPPPPAVQATGASCVLSADLVALPLPTNILQPTNCNVPAGSGIVSLGDLLREITLHHNSDELRHLVIDLRTKKIDLRMFCSRARQLVGIRVLFDMVLGLRQAGKEQHTTALAAESAASGTSSTTMSTAAAPALPAAKHDRRTILVHSLFCGASDCPLEQCRTTKQQLAHVKQHVMQCSPRGLQEEQGSCADCLRWRQLQRLKEKCRGKLVGIVKASSAHGANRWMGGSLPGIFRHRLDLNAGIAQRILSKSVGSHF